MSSKSVYSDIGINGAPVILSIINNGYVKVTWVKKSKPAKVRNGPSRRSSKGSKHTWRIKPPNRRIKKIEQK